jgi:hypothetical protein
MYDPAAVLQHVSDHPVPVLLFGGIAIIANLVYYTETYRLAARDACMPLTLLAVATFLPHDGNYVLNADKWFNDYDHWFPILFWVALIVTITFALAFLRQIVVHGRKELALPIDQTRWTALCIAAVVAGSVLWGVLKANIDDDLYLLTFMLTITWCAVSGAGLLLRRGTSRGQSVRQWTAYTVMASGFFLCSQFLGDGFHGLGWYSLSAVTILGGVGMVIAVSRAPAYRPATALSPLSAPNRLRRTRGYERHRPLGHRRDRQARVVARVGRHGRPVAHEQVLVAEHAVARVDDATLRARPDDRAPEDVRGDRDVREGLREPALRDAVHTLGEPPGERVDLGDERRIGPLGILLGGQLDPAAEPPPPRAQAQGVVVRLHRGDEHGPPRVSGGPL